MAHISAKFSPAIHWLAHTVAGIAAARAIGPCPPEIIILSIIMALLPDADDYLGLPHRGASHSILAIAAIGLLGFISDSPDTIAGVAAYASHITLDLLHGNGIQLLWPSRRFYSIINLSPAGLMLAATILLATTTIPTRHHQAILAALLPPTFTPTPTLTPTYTPTPTFTPTRTPDFFAIEEARLRWKSALLAAEATCQRSNQQIECERARIAAEIAYLDYLRLLPPTFTPTPPPTGPTPTPTPPPTLTPSLPNCYYLPPGYDWRQGCILATPTHLRLATLFPTP